MTKIGIKRKYWFGYKKYRCKEWYFVTDLRGKDAQGNMAWVPCKPYMVLILQDDTLLALCDIDSRSYVVYPPSRSEKLLAERNREREEVLRLEKERIRRENIHSEETRNGTQAANVG